MRDHTRCVTARIARRISDGAEPAVLTPGSEPADDIRRILSALVDERRHLSCANADSAFLEANRLAIAYWQHELRRRLPRRST